MRLINKTKQNRNYARDNYCLDLIVIGFKRKKVTIIILEFEKLTIFPLKWVNITLCRYDI